ncbi:TetR/AcrR family transcriptional regulator [Rhodococcus sp. NPDC058521]|uniref:TetR/AcrR family transcriptional regulator n=1 Tax=Rhodococcus sp. NPDC058521 TaxID=3346536 RepID=UPI00364A4C55
MLNRLPADERRAQLIESALAIAEQRGVASVTVRAVAEEAGVSLGVVHYCFESKEALLAAMGQALVLQLSESLRVAFGQVRHAPQLVGVTGLRELLHIGLSAMWPILEETPDRQLLTYEITALSLRHRAGGAQHAGEIANEQYRIMDDEAAGFFEECARMAKVRWLEPVESVSRFALAVLDGLVLRWLVDRDGEAMIAALDDLVRVVADKATEA